MFQAKDIMTTNLITIKSEAKVKEAVKLIVKNNISGLPVVDENGEVIGVVSEKDLLDLLFNPDDLDAPISKIMMTRVTTIPGEATLFDVGEVFLSNSFRRLPVVDSENKIIGLISRRDLLRTIDKLQ